MKEICEIENNAKYFGEWIDNERCGKGVIVWKDGSKYEGYLFRNQVNTIKSTETHGEREKEKEKAPCQRGY